MPDRNESENVSNGNDLDIIDRADVVVLDEGEGSIEDDVMMAEAKEGSKEDHQFIQSKRNDIEMEQEGSKEDGNIDMGSKEDYQSIQSRRDYIEDQDMSKKDEDEDMIMVERKEGQSSSTIVARKHVKTVKIRSIDSTVDKPYERNYEDAVAFAWSPEDMNNAQKDQAVKLAEGFNFQPMTYFSSRGSEINVLAHSSSVNQVAGESSLVIKTKSMKRG